MQCVVHRGRDEVIVSRETRDQQPERTQVEHRVAKGTVLGSTSRASVVLSHLGDTTTTNRSRVEGKLTAPRRHRRAHSPRRVAEQRSGGVFRVAVNVIRKGERVSGSRGRGRGGAKRGRRAESSRQGNVRVHVQREVLMASTDLATTAAR